MKLDTKPAPRAQADGADLAAAIPAVGDHCVYGAMHGLLDGFALYATTLDEFATVAEICQSLSAEIVGGCTDGMGHAAWDVYGDFAMTAQACATLADVQLRYSCDTGVLMRRYERNNRLTGTSTAEYKEFTAQLRQDCADWERLSPRIDEPGGSGAGCWAAAQYMLWEPISYLVRDYPEERWRGVENFDELLDEVYRTCASFGPVGEQLCRREDGNHIAAVVNYQPADFAPVCAKMRDRVQECVRKANELLVYNTTR